ncbi:unnamed protein product, partial [Polarella glacialis]
MAAGSSPAAEEIDASQNQLGWRGCKTLVDLCLKCKDLRVVKLFKNELTDKAVPALCKLAEECPGLEQLHLSYNRLSGDGASQIIAAAARGRAG